MLMFINRLKTICFLANKGKWMFSTQQTVDGNTIGNHEVRIAQHKAYLSRQIQSMIKYPHEDINQQSLKYQILNFLDKKDPITTIEQEAKTSFYQLFQKGYSLKQQFTKQKRVSDVQLALTDQKGIIFYPTNFVTGTIFQKFDGFKSHKLLYGHFGISKTFTAMLYQILNDFIVDYQIRYPEVSWPAELGKIITQCSKVIYWSINLEKDNPSDFMNLIKNQLNKAELQELQKLGYFNGTNKKPLKDFYKQKRIDLKLIIDQINQLLSQDRQLQQIQKSSVSKESTANEELLSDQRYIFKSERLNKVKNLIESAFYHCDNIIFQSSVNIEKQRWKKIYKDYFKHSSKSLLQLSPSEYLNEIILAYNNQYADVYSKLEMADFFLYRFEEEFPMAMEKIRKNLKKSKQQMHNILRNALKQIINETSEEKYYLTHFSIRFWLQRQTISRYLMRQKQQRSILNKFKSMFKQAIQTSILLVLTEKVQQFLNKQPDLFHLKAYLLLQLYIFFEKNKMKGLSKQNLLKINKSDINIVQKDKYFIKIEKSIDNHLFKHDNQTIELLIPPQTFFSLKISGELLSKYVVKTVFSIQAQAILQNVVGKSQMGSTIETMLIQCMAQGYQDVKFISFDQNILRQYKNIQQDVYSFNSLPRSDEKLSEYSFVSAMNYGLNKMINILNQCDYAHQINNIFIPIGVDQKQLKQDKVQNQIQQSNETSKAIDFILANYNKKTKTFVINCFDVAIQSDKKNFIQQKLIKFLEQYNQIKNKDSKIVIDGTQYTMKVNYYVTTNLYDKTIVRNNLVGIVQKNNSQLSPTFEYNILKHIKNDQLLNEIGHLALKTELSIQPSAKLPYKPYLLYDILDYLVHKKEKTN